MALIGDCPGILCWLRIVGCYLLSQTPAVNIPCQHQIAAPCSLSGPMPPEP